MMGDLYLIVSSSFDGCGELLIYPSETRIYLRTVKPQYARDRLPDPQREINHCRPKNSLEPQKALLDDGWIGSLSA